MFCVVVQRALLIIANAKFNDNLIDYQFAAINLLSWTNVAEIDQQSLLRLCMGQKFNLREHFRQVCKHVVAVNARVRAGLYCI
jgi:hypothetical protein